MWWPDAVHKSRESSGVGESRRNFFRSNNSADPTKPLDGLWASRPAETGRQFKVRSVRQQKRQPQRVPPLGDDRLGKTILRSFPGLRIYEVLEAVFVAQRKRFQVRGNALYIRRRILPEMTFVFPAHAIRLVAGSHAGHPADHLAFRPFRRVGPTPQPTLPNEGRQAPLGPLLRNRGSFLRSAGLARLVAPHFQGSADSVAAETQALGSRVQA